MLAREELLVTKVCPTFSFAVSEFALSTCQPTRGAPAMRAISQAGPRLFACFARKTRNVVMLIKTTAAAAANGKENRNAGKRQPHGRGCSGASGSNAGAGWSWR